MMLFGYSHRRHASNLLTGLMLAIFTPAFAQQTPAPSPPPETPEARDARMGWWREARFGMFIHWGLYAELAGAWNGKQIPGIGEWIMNNAKIPVADYAALAAHFDPVKFDADQWVSIARNAGMKYIVITAKHHDGFAMFKSAANPFNIYDATPFKRDPLKELAAACLKQGIKLGFYYSQDQDWTAPGGAALHGGHWDKAQDGSFADYLHTKAIPQLKELLTNYEPFPAVLWFDTPTSDMTPALAGEIMDIVREHPGLIINNRLGGGFKGDTETPEQHIPPQGYPDHRDWETCMTINGTWGYKSYDTDFKSPETLLRNLIDIASKGGNYLLNVGPTAEGVIPAPEVDRLAQIGQWLKVNGDAIYGSGPTPFGDEAGSFSGTEKDKKTGKPVFVPAWDWRCTAKPGELFFSIFKWPVGPFKLPAINGKVAQAYLLADPGHQPLKIAQDAGVVTVELPAQAP